MEVMKIEKTPFDIHVMVCQNTRPDQPEKKSCGGPISTKVAEDLKKFVDENHLKPRVRITSTKCLGPCAHGPNVMLYPQEVWFSECDMNSADQIKKKIMELLRENAPK